MTNIPMKSITSGTKVFIKTHNQLDENATIFMGFTDKQSPSDEIPVFKDFKSLSEKHNIKTFKELEEKNDSSPGQVSNALFFDTEQLFFWQAYLYKGRWCLGTSADPFQMVLA